MKYRRIDIKSLFLQILLLCFFFFSFAHKASCEEDSGFSLDPNKLRIPVGEIRQIILKNKPDTEIKLKYDKKVIDANISKDGKSIIVNGKTTGATRLAVTSGKKILYAEISVMEYAGKAPSELTVKVSGNPCPRWVMKTAVLSNLEQLIELKGGSSYTPSWPLLEDIFPCEERSFFISLLISGKDYINRKCSVRIIVKNAPFQATKPTRLIVSNNPEAVSTVGIIFDRVFLENTPHRLFFHHRNGGEVPLTMKVNIFNEGPEPCEIFISGGSAGPDPVEVQVGHVAALKYFYAVTRQTGWFLNLAPSKSFTVSSFDTKPGGVIAGIYDIWPIKGFLLRMKLYSALPGNSPIELTIPKKSNNHPCGIFENPEITAEYTHLIGGKYTFITVGNEPFLKEVSDSSPDFGNYGVLYTIKIKIINPHAEKKQAKLYFVPRAGKSKAVVVIDGQVIDLPSGQHAEQIIIKSYTLEPGEEKLLELLTIPQGGSNYPVHFLILSDYIKE